MAWIGATNIEDISSAQVHHAGAGYGRTESEKDVYVDFAALPGPSHLKRMRLRLVQLALATRGGPLAVSLRHQDYGVGKATALRRYRSLQVSFSSPLGTSWTLGYSRSSLRLASTLRHSLRAGLERCATRQPSTVAGPGQGIGREDH